jgi:hypothetical protein
MRTAWIYLIIVSFMLSLPVAGTLSAQEYGFRAGDRELTIVGSGSSDENFDGTNVSLGLGLGYFLTDVVSVGLRQDASYVDIQGGSDLWNGSTRVALDLHLPVRGFHPYIGANLGYIYGDNVRDQFIAGPEAGVKVFATPSSFIYGSLEYQFLFRSARDIDDQFDDGRFVYGVGIGMIF